MKLETDRLVIRPIQETDSSSLADLWSDPDVTYYMGGPRDYKEVLNSFKEDARLNPQPKFDLWPVVEKVTDQIVGNCGLIDKEVEDQIEFELVYVFVKSAWGKGYATEIASSIADYAFKQFGLKRIISLIDPKNRASEHVTRKIGMQYEKDIVRESGKIMRVYSKNRED